MEIILVRGSEAYLADRILSDLIPGNYRVEKAERITEESIGNLSEESFLFEGNVLLWETAVLGAEEETFALLKESAGRNGKVIIRAKSVRGNTRFLKWLTENARVIDCEPLSERDFLDFLSGENERRGGVLTKEQIVLFAGRSRYGTPGIDLYMVDGWLSELELLGKAGEQVTDDDVKEAVQAGDVGTAFELIGLLSRGSYQALFDKASSVRDDVLMVLGALLYSMRILSKLKIAGIGEIGISGFQAGSVRPLLFLSKGQIDQMVDAVSEGMELRKSGVDDREVMAQVLSNLCLIRSGQAC